MIMLLVTFHVLQAPIRGASKCDECSVYIIVFPTLQPSDFWVSANSSNINTSINFQAFIVKDKNNIGCDETMEEHSLLSSYLSFSFCSFSFLSFSALASSASCFLMSTSTSFCFNTLIFVLPSSRVRVAISTARVGATKSYVTAFTGFARIISVFYS